MHGLKILYRLLDSRERERAVSLAFLIALSASLEAAVVAGMLPFLALLFSPDARLKSGGIMSTLMPLFGAIDTRLRVSVGLSLIVLIVVARSVALATSTLQMRFVYDVGDRVSRQLLMTYLCLPYERFVEMDLSRAATQVLQEGDQVAQNALRPLTQIVESSVTLLALAAVLFRVASRPAAVIFLSLGMIYGLFYAGRRSRVHLLGARRAKANQGRSKIAIEAFGGLKEIRVAGLERRLLARFSAESHQFARLNAENQVVQLSSQYVIEALAISTIVGAAVFYGANRASVNRIMPAFGFFVFGAFRMLPAFHRLLANATQLRYFNPTLRAIAADLQMETEVDDAAAPQSVAFDKSVVLEHVTVRRSSRNLDAIIDVSLHIRKGSSVALIGRTGAGKSTIADVLLALLTPTAGRLAVDGIPITPSNRRAWQAKVGYVPQRIYLAHDTIRANIAFGVDRAEIDEEALDRAMRMARLEEFVATLPDGFDTVVGDRGVQLSGGQQQRIGIARALYRQPEFLVLDEATSDLDPHTQSEIIGALRESKRSLTTFIIAHRHAAAAWCDVVYLIDAGRVIASGSIDEMSARFANVSAIQH